MPVFKLLTHPFAAFSYLHTSLPASINAQTAGFTYYIYKQYTAYTSNLFFIYKH